MSASTELLCRSEQRRHDSRRAPLHGLDFVEVELTAQDCTLQVFFLGKAPQGLREENVRISGGQRIRDVRVKEIRVQRQIDPTLDDLLEVVVVRPGDALTYTLSLVALDEAGRPTDEPMTDFDPRYASIDFTFRAGCPTDLDCKTPVVCPAPPREQPEINYLAKDYESFRRLILDRLALTLPDWRDHQVPDLGITLVEVLAYVGDYLSYYQDAVATEAYLGTARQRISVRRHARLVDYVLHEGCNARAWVTIGTDTDATLDARKIFFLAGLAEAPDTRTLQPAEYAALAPGNYEVFEPLLLDRSEPIRLRALHSELHFYTWGDCACCLPVGATAATLTDRWIETKKNPDGREIEGPNDERAGDGPAGTERALDLRVGDVLIFEEVVSPTTGNPADADPTHRQAVRLTKVTQTIDPLYHPQGADFGQPLVDIEWCSEDALRFPLCISAKMPQPECDCRKNLSVARGNVVLVDSGSTQSEPVGEVPEASRTDTCGTACEPPDAIVTPAKFRPTLSRRPLTFAQPLPPCGCVAALVQQDARRALPELWLSGTQSSPQGEIVTAWSSRADLLKSGGEEAHFVVEIDDGGSAHVRFGDGNLGRMPDAGTRFAATYRIGNGPGGNVGAETIRAIVFRETTSGLGALAPRNPLPAHGGTAPESIEEAKLFAPLAFQNELKRAITAEDYAVLAADDARRLAQRSSHFDAPRDPFLPPHTRSDDPRAADEVEPGKQAPPDARLCSAPFQRLQGARATLRWNGSWYEALVALDPLGRQDAPPELADEVEAYLEPYRRLGHDLAVRGARYVPIDLMLSICVKPHFQRGHVEAALLEVFGSRASTGGALGFFHPDNLRLGDDLYVSRIVAAAHAVPGVMEAHVIQLERFDPSEPTPDLEDELPPDGVLSFGPFEIARLDNDPSFPENGRLRIVLRGGR